MKRYSLSKRTSISLFVAGALAAMSAPALSIHAPPVEWTGGAGNADFLGPDNWGGSVPGPGEVFNISSSGNLTVQLNGVASVAGGVVDGSGNGSSLNVGDAANAGNLSISGVLTIGQTGTGVLNQNNGSTSAGSLILGSQSGSSGTVYLNGGTINDDIIVGDAGTGSFTNSGGTHNVSGNLILGNQAGGVGSYTITGEGTQTNVGFVPGGNGPGNPNGALIVGNAGSGTFNQGLGTDAPSVSIAGDLALGLQSGSQGTYTLNSGTLDIGGVMLVGAASTGNNQFIQNGGTVNLNGSAGGNGDYASTSAAYGNFAVRAGNLLVGGETPFDNGTGTYTLTGGQLNASSIYVGYSGTGYFNQSGGSVTTAYIDLGDCGGCNGGNSFGKYTLTGGTLNTSGLSVGDFGHGEFVQNGAGSVINIAGDLSIGNGPAAHPNIANPGNYDRSGSYELDAGTLNTVNTIVGSQGVGTFTQNGGQHNVSQTLTLGQQYTPDNGQIPVSFGGPAPGIYNMNGGTLSANQMVIGDAGDGTFNHAGGDVSVSGALILGNQGPTGVGKYQMDAGTLTAGTTIVGNAGQGSFIQSGGSVDTAAASLGLQGSGVGSYTLSGGSLHTGSGYLVVGDAGQGSFGQTGGTVTVDNVLVIGQGAGGVGTYTLGGGVLGSGEFLVGDAGTGTFTNSGGTQTVSDGITLGSQASGKGSYSLSSGSLTTGWMDVGASGSGVFAQSGGTATVSNNLVLGRDGTGFYILNSSGATLNAGEIVLGANGTGSFDQSRGAVNSVTLVVGYNTAGKGSYTLSGGDLASTGYQRIGLDGTGNFSQSGGTNTVGQDQIVGQNGGAIGTYTLSGGQNTVNGWLLIGRSAGAQGSFTQTGGTNTVNGGLNVGQYGSGTYSLSGGDLSVAGDISVAKYAGSSGTLNMQGGSLSAAKIVNKGTLDYRNGSIALGGGSGTLDNSGQFNVSGGTSAVPLVLAGNLSNAGTTTVSTGNALNVSQATDNSGSMVLNGRLTTDSFVNTGDLTINANAKLTTHSFSQTAGSTKLNGGAIDPPPPLTIDIGGGSFGGVGTVTGNLYVHNGANLFVGPGLLDIEGSLTQSGGELDFLMNGLVTTDLNVTQGYSLDGVKLVFDFSDPSLLPSSFNIASYITGSAGSLSNDSFWYEIGNGPLMALTYDAQTGYLSTGGSTVPEPGEVELMLTALCVLGLIGRRRRQTSLTTA